MNAGERRAAGEAARPCDVICDAGRIREIVAGYDCSELTSNVVGALF
jgi:hypothetical protein